ncbi:MAG TPA: prephenate dehydrogenase/arogenate dehydrogenase family protein [Candidatus Binataceae bacterium]|nr:prephenate dehydrogenase/arogenate dehydrogenase family protein [Candidatus Binataceae bacterium]
MPELFKQMTVCGVGLIGGSLALIARRAGLAKTIVGLGRTRKNLDIAVKRKLIDRATRDPIEAARGADLIVLAVPILTMRRVLEPMLPYCAPGAIITDVGSVKGFVVRELEPLIAGKMSLVAAHPIAGKETAGAGAADPDLFRNRRVIITPSKTSTPAAIKKIETLWKATGARVEKMDPDSHDKILARASHLPQVVASALAAALGGEKVAGKTPTEYGAGGLRDTTRIAASPWEVWRDIFIANQAALATAMKRFEIAYAEFQRLIEMGDLDRLEPLFNRGRAMRERLK